MTLTVNQPILENEILDVASVKGGKIFILTGTDGNRIALKAEPKVTGDKIKAVAPVVKAIDPTVKMKPLKQAEVQALKNFTKTYHEDYKVWETLIGIGYNIPESQQERQAMLDLDACLSAYGGCDSKGLSDIAKMEFAQMTTMGIALDLEKSPDDEAIANEARRVFAKFAKALRKSGGFEKLGTIMAADFFIGNNDRFSENGFGMKVTLYGNKHTLKTITNLGNIIVTKPGKGKKTSMSMLDYMDPNTQWLDLTKDLSAIENTAGQWPMRALLDKQGRKKIAGDLVDDLNFILKPKNPRVGYDFCSKHSVSRVEEGMVDAIRGIRKALSRKAGMGKLMTSYYQALQGVT